MVIGIILFSGQIIKYFFVSSKSPAMKKLFRNSNPFILLLAPLAFAIIMGVCYQFEQKKEFTEGTCTVQATSLFVKGITLVKTVCAISKEKVW